MLSSVVSEVKPSSSQINNAHSSKGVLMETTTNSKTKNLLLGLSNDKRIKKLLEQFQVLTEEVKKRKKQEPVASAVEAFQGALKNIQTLENKIEGEIEKTLEKVKSSTKELEKNLKTYKEIALQQVRAMQKTKTVARGKSVKKKVSTKKMSKASPKKKTQKRATSKV